MLFRSTSEWSALAQALGFVPHAASAGFGLQASFRQLKRVLGPVAGPPPAWSHWLYGSHRGSEALVLLYETGSGSSRITSTAVVVRIDPSLFLGASISQESMLSELFDGFDVQLGIPMFDEALRLGALDRRRLVALLYPSDARSTQLLQALVRHTRAGMRVTDSTVTITLSGVVADPALIGQSLEHATWVAQELAHRRASMPATPEDSALRVAWEAHANSRGMEFDAGRMRMAGVVNGTRVEVALETNAARIQTAVTVHWPQPLGVNVRLRKSSGLSLLGDLFVQDIDTDDPGFDQMFVIQGSPEPWVRRVFAHPDLRAALMSIAPQANELTFNHSECFWLWPGALQTQRDLDAHVAMALRVSAALFGTVQSSGPYR